MQGIWADIQGVRTFVGDQSVAIGDQPFGDIIKFLDDYNFKDLETTNLPSGNETPASERTFQHRDGRTVMLVQRFGPWGIPSIDGISGSDGDVANSPFPMETVGDLVKFVIGGRKTDDPEKPAIMDQGKDALSSAIGSVYGKVEPVSVPSAYSKSFAKIGIGVQKWYPGCSAGHMKKEEGCVHCEELGPTAGILPTGVRPAEVAKMDQTSDVYRGQAQNPVAGGNTYMDQGSDQSRAMGRDGSLNPMYGAAGAAAAQTPKVTFEEIMQSPAYTSDDGLDIWNTYRQEDLEPPDEIRITLDPITGEVMQVAYSNENASQLPFMGTPAMPVNPFADSPQPTPMTEEAPQKQMDPASGQLPSGMMSGQAGQPHMSNQPTQQQPVAAPQPHQPPQTQSQNPGQSQSQPSQSQSNQSQPSSSKPQTLSPEQLQQTPQTPEWTSPDPSSNEEGVKPPPNVQLQRAFRKMARLSN